tara:strand:+ start:6432 stop:6875 length:444 start_codon:yes stop_codon:yes gene_type:complete
MSGVNKVILIGNAGNDPEFRVMPNGNGVANLSIATSESWKDKNTGEKQEKTEWHRVIFFNKQAEVINQYVKKGSKLYVEGRLQTRSWEQDGVKKYTTEIVASEFQFLDSKGEGKQESQSRPHQSAEQRGQPQAAATGYDNFDDSIPF